MRIQQWTLDKIHLYPNNPRVNDDAVEAVAKSIDTFGFRQPVVVDTDGIIICGHTRFKAAQRLGLEKIPVHVARDLTPEQIRAYRIADNKTAELAEWNPELLSLELTDLLQQNYAIGKRFRHRRSIRRNARCLVREHRKSVTSWSRGLHLGWLLQLW